MTPDTLWNHLPNLVAILAIFTLDVASPGPKTLMILGTAMASGRVSAIALSLGVVLGAMAWAFVATFGFVAALKASEVLFMALKLAGGLYLIFLAAMSWHSAFTKGAAAAPRSAGTGSLPCAKARLASSTSQSMSSVRPILSRGRSASVHVLSPKR
jgi:threonine/homoserine/homoserine lactone efflux protein